MLHVPRALLGLVVVLLVAAGAAEVSHAAAPASQAASRPGSSVGRDEKINPNLPTLWLVGDSTVRVNGKGQQGWGDPVGDFFDKSRINVVNRAIGGRSSRTFQTEGRWDDVLKSAKKGDFVIIQFGHNDGGKLAGDNRERGTIRGLGDETEEVTLTLKQGKKETVHTFGWYMRKYINDAREKGLTPIVCSPVAHVPKAKVTDATPENWDYVRLAEQVAQAEKADFIPLNTLIMKRWVGMEPAEIKEKYFTPADGTHTGVAGAKLNAEAAVEGIRNLKDNPLKSYLKESPSSEK